MVTHLGSVTEDLPLMRCSMSRGASHWMAPAIYTSRTTATVEYVALRTQVQRPAERLMSRATYRQPLSLSLAQHTIQVQAVTLAGRSHQQVFTPLLMELWQDMPPRLPKFGLCRPVGRSAFPAPTRHSQRHRRAPSLAPPARPPTVPRVSRNR